MELLNKKIIICPTTGRLGNQLLNIILAISLCIQHDINLIKLPKKPLFYDKDFILFLLFNLKISKFGILSKL